MLVFAVLVLLAVIAAAAAGFAAVTTYMNLARGNYRPGTTFSEAFTWALAGWSILLGFVLAVAAPVMNQVRASDAGGADDLN